MSYVKCIITISGMNLNKHQITYWQDREFWLGYINEFPEYTTQGLTLDELIINLKDIYNDVTQNIIS